MNTQPSAVARRPAARVEQARARGERKRRAAARTEAARLFMLVARVIAALLPTRACGRPVRALLLLQ